MGKYSNITKKSLQLSWTINTIRLYRKQLHCRLRDWIVTSKCLFVQWEYDNLGSVTFFCNFRPLISYTSHCCNSCGNVISCWHNKCPIECNAMYQSITYYLGLILLHKIYNDYQKTMYGNCIILSVKQKTFKY